ncbi:hypothetical protein TWF594_009428 [Orbilia oligospora]|nr:hypothetical protein TWF594_009428 [Orbilia oligospora]
MWDTGISDGIKGVLKQMDIEWDPFTATLSFPISAKGTLDTVGSAGFFLGDGGEDNNIYLVTARHVALVESLEESQVEYTKADTNQPKKEIVRIGSNADLQQIVGDMASKIESLDERGLAIENAFENGIATPDDRASLTLTSSKVVKLEDLHKHIDTQWGTVESRVLGELVWAPPISFSIQPGRTTLDLAVIKIGPGILDENNFLGNVIHFGDRLTNVKIRKMVKTDPTIATSFKIPEDRLVRLRGQTPNAEVANPSMKNSNGDNCPIVFKHGPKSGVTFGKASRVSCYTRRIWEGVEILSRELAVLVLGRG